MLPIQKFSGRFKPEIIVGCDGVRGFEIVMKKRERQALLVDFPGVDFPRGGHEVVFAILLIVPSVHRSDTENVIIEFYSVPPVADVKFNG